MADYDRMAELLDGKAFPNGEEWRCGRCDFTCGDDGPDRCPRDGTPLTRTVLAFKLHGGRAPGDGDG